jgi:hypothetical protein
MDLPLKYLDPGAMIAVTGHWLTDPLFASIPQVKTLLPQIEQVHADLVAAKPAEPVGNDDAVAALIVELVAKDLQHDHGLRAPYYLLMAAEEHALAQDPPDEAAAAECASARAALFPSGLAGTRAGYLTEEGNAKKAGTLLAKDAGVKKLLGALYLEKKTTAVDLMDAYVALAGEVGDLERKKLVAQGEAAASAVPASFATARNAWIDLVQTVVRILGHVKGKAAETIRRGVEEPATKAQKAALAAAKAAKAAKAAADKAGQPNS